MSDCKNYPADTVDIYGNVWPTVGENIRNGMFGKNVKVGYVYIDNGYITSPDFNITSISSSSFKIEGIIVIFAFTENIENGKFNFNIDNLKDSSRINNNQPYNNVYGTIKIIYKEII